MQKTRTSCRCVVSFNCLGYINCHSSDHTFDSPGRAPCTLPATSTSTPNYTSCPPSTTNPLTRRWRSPPSPSTTSPKIFSSTFHFISTPRVSLRISSSPHLLTYRAQEPVLAYRPPSYNYHLPPDLDRSARCGLFEDQANAYATSSSEASPCLATPQTLHPTQAFGI